MNLSTFAIAGVIGVFSSLAMAAPSLNCDVQNRVVSTKGRALIICEIHSPSPLAKSMYENLAKSMFANMEGMSNIEEPVHNEETGDLEGYNLGTEYMYCNRNPERTKFECSQAYDAKTGDLLPRKYSDY